MGEQFIIKIKQGEALYLPFTIALNNSVYDLTDKTIKFLVKKSPLASSVPIVTKTITSTSDQSIDGLITNAQAGKFQVYISTIDTSYPINKYYLVIQIVDSTNNTIDIISSDAGSVSIFEICEQ